MELGMGNDNLNVKKFLTAICAACLLMTGCGGESTPDENSQANIVKLGMITHLNASEKQMEEHLFKVQSKTHAKVVNHVPVFYDSLNLMLMGAEAGAVDEISTYKSVADYVLAKNSHYGIANVEWIKGLADNFCFAVRAEDTALKADLDRVIGDMKSDGSLNKLIDYYITNAIKDKNPPSVDIPKFDGAEVIKVGVTGDLPPLDLILPDNSPAGFNTAMLAEVAKRLNKNIELVQIDSGARAAAINSDQIDVIFWAIVPDGDNLPADIDKPDGLEFTAPYFKDDVAHLKLKK